MGIKVFSFMLSLRKIKKYYDKHLVLDLPFLELDSKIYWARGTNGSGKTTLLRMVAGLLPFEGNILFQQISLKHHPATYRKHVSWADAEPLYPTFLTGSELIKFYRGIHRSPARDADNLIELFGMQDFIGNKTATYSSGMMKKLSLVLAFLGNTPVMVLDEPLITLDAAALDAVCALILESHSHSGTTFLLSSHMDLDTSLITSAQELSVQHKSVTPV